jgi:hypothetical protein
LPSFANLDYDTIAVLGNAPVNPPSDYVWQEKECPKCKISTAIPILKIFGMCNNCFTKEQL